MCGRYVLGRELDELVEEVLRRPSVTKENCSAGRKTTTTADQLVKPLWRREYVEEHGILRGIEAVEVGEEARDNVRVDLARTH